MIYFCVWKYFLLASISDVKPKAMFSIVYKSPGCKPVVLWEFFPSFFPKLGSVWSIPLLASTGQGLYLNLLNSTLGCAKRWKCEKQFAHPNCPESRGRAAGLALFFLACFAISEWWSRENLELWVIFSASCFELPENALSRLSSGRGVESQAGCAAAWKAVECRSSSLADLLFLFHLPSQAL